jgi:hypothetical protein
MNKILIVFCLILFSLSVSAQQFSQYNTNTLYDSFENPSQRSFIPDSSRHLAFNFLIPNFDVNTYLTGNAQRGIKTRLFSKNSSYYTDNLRKGKLNHFNGNANAYAIMFKIFTSLNGDVEIGFSAQTKAESRGLFTDESLALFNGSRNFSDNSYTNVFNDNYRFQSYHQLGFSYREKINKKIAVGFKVSALLGIQYQRIDINQSQIDFNKPADQATLALQGRYYDSYDASYIPSLRNPGAAITLGGSYITDDHIKIQANIKDLGFIHWSKKSAVYDFDNNAVLNNISTSPNFEKDLYDATNQLFQSNGTQKSFTTPINGHAEISANKSYYLDYDYQFKYSPTLILSKELFFSGVTGALVNQFQYKNLSATLSTSYDDMKFFNVGTQFMVKAPNVEFFIGTDRLINSGRLALAALRKQGEINRVGNYTGGDFYLGFSMKFGHVIEHPMNASTIPMGEEKGFIGRFFDSIFKSKKTL